MLIRERTVGYFLTAAGLLFIAKMTLEPHPELADLVRTVPHVRFVWAELALQDLVLNILLFVPLGLGLRLCGLRPGVALAIAILTTITVELLQYTVIVGRHASLSDVLSNSFGGWVGILLGHHWRTLVFPDPRKALGLALAGIGSWLGLEALTSVLMTISLPENNYWVLWSPNIPQYYARFEGAITEATVGALSIPDGRVADSRALRAQLEKDPFVLRVRARGQSVGEGLAPIIFVVDERDHRILLLAQEKHELFFGVRTRAWDAGLRGPSIRLPLMKTESNQPMEIRAGLFRGRLFLELSQAGESYRRELALSPSWGWQLLLPDDYAFAGATYCATALWLAGLLLPIGYWSGRALTSAAAGPATLVVLATAAFGLSALPAAVQLPPAHWSEWLAAGVGLGGGGLVGQLSARGKRQRA